MDAVTIRLKGKGNENHTSGVGYSGGVVIFVRGIARVTEPVAKEFEEAGYAERIESVGGTETTSFFVIEGHGHAGAIEKENLSRLNITDDPTLGTRALPDNFTGRFAINNEDSPVKHINANSALETYETAKTDEQVPVANRDKASKERADKAKEKAKKLKEARDME